MRVLIGIAALLASPALAQNGPEGGGPNCIWVADDTSEASVGFPPGGDTVAMVYVPNDCLSVIGGVELFFGSPTNPDPNLDGLPVRLVVLADLDGDGDPISGTAVLYDELSPSVVSQSGTDTSVALPLNSPADGTGFPGVFVAVIVTHAADQFPFAVDFDSGPDPTSFISGDIGSWSSMNPAGNDFPPLATDVPYQLCATAPVPPDLCVTYCHNDADGEGGAVNSTGVGAFLCATGSNSVSSAGGLTLLATDVPNSSGLFFSGPTQLADTPFGDGFLCIAAPLQRLLPVVTAQGNIAFRDVAPDSVMAVTGTVSHFQYWFRDLAAMNNLFNLSNGCTVTWTP